MRRESVSELVRKAKGDDRSIREYAKDSEVDAAVISKIIKGTYTPKKADVYKKLTRSIAKPRGGVTYQQLVEASNSEKSFQDGLTAGKNIMKASALMLGGVAAPMVAPAVALGVLAERMKQVSKELSKELSERDDDKLKKLGQKCEEITKNLNNEKKTDETLFKEYQRYMVMANGLIINLLILKGIVFGNKSKKIEELNSQFDTVLKIENQPIEDYLFRYVYLSEEQRQNDEVVKYISKKSIEELLFIKPSNNRKVSIVVNSMEAYDYLVKFKNKISYNGELSIILVDVENVNVVREDYISHYSGENAPDVMLIV